jgi:choline dehydrogenase-like flavoprotein
VLDLPVVDRFDATRTARVPAGGWAFAAAAPGADSAAALLRRHGVRVLRLEAGRAARPLDVETFRADSVVTAPRAFQGHRTVRLAGAWRRGPQALAAGDYLVPADQPLAALALVLLDPEADDGLVTWNVWDRALRPGADFPVLRVVVP